MKYREGNLLKRRAGSEDAQFAGSYKVIALERGGYVSTQQSAVATITLATDHGFTVGDRFWNPLASEYSAPIDVVTATTIAWTGGETYTVYAGDYLVNIGGDTFTGGTPDWDGSPRSIYADPAKASAYAQATVTVDSEGRYDYWYADVRGWELILDPAGAPVTFIPSSDPFEVVNVEDYGAIPDQTTDCSPAVVAALAAVPSSGGRLHFPGPGDYRFVSSVDIDRSDLEVSMGVAARIYADPPDNTGIKCLHFAPSSGRLSNITLSNIRAYDPDPVLHDGSGSGGDESHGIVAEQIDGLVIHDGNLENFGDEAFDIINCQDVTVEDLILKDNGATSGAGGSLGLTNCDDVIIRSVQIRSIKNGAGIRAQYNDNSGAGVERAGLIIEGCNMRSLQNLDAAEDGGVGIMINIVGTGSLVGTIVRGNQIQKPENLGITVIRPSGSGTIRGIAIQGNTVEGGGTGADTGAGVHRGAINVTGGVEAASITGNVVDNWGNSTQSHYGIRSEAPKSVIDGNVIYDNAAAVNASIRNAGAGSVTGDNYQPDGVLP